VCLCSNVAKKDAPPLWKGETMGDGGGVKEVHPSELYPVQC